MLKLLPIFVVILCVNGEALVSEIPQKEIYDLTNVHELFKDFHEKYDKKYEGLELRKRLRIFADNLEKINMWNREDPNAVFGIGPFADMESKEFLGCYAGYMANSSNAETNQTIPYVATGMAPESLDWRQKNLVTRVKNQGMCGSCYVFAAVGSIEGQHAKATGQLVSLSEQQGLDCNPRGCEGGYVEEVIQTYARLGCMEECDYAYVGRKGQCRADPSKSVVKVTGGGQLSVNSEEGLKDALANYGPLAIAISTSDSMQHLRGGVYTPLGGECSAGMHALIVVGYGTDRGVPYWLLKNSWGQNWNEQGYLRLVRGQGACQIGQYVYHSNV